MQVLYPLQGSRLFLPRDYDGVGQVLILRAAAPPKGALHWYLDQRYMGRTTERHQLPVRLGPGAHRVMVLDADGHSASISFEVLARPSA